MAHSELCPVCKGSGQYTVNNYYQDCSLTVPQKPQISTCHGCNGAGWVTVLDRADGFLCPLTEVSE